MQLLISFPCNLRRLILFDNFYLLTTVTPMCLFVFQHERLLPLSMLAGYCECGKISALNLM